MVDCQVFKGRTIDIIAGRVVVSGQWDLTRVCRSSSAVGAVFWRVASWPLAIRIGRVARGWAVAWSTSHDVVKNGRRNERLLRRSSMRESKKRQKKSRVPSVFLLAYAEAERRRGRGEREE